MKNGDKVPAPLEFERVSNSLSAGLRQEWVSGDNGRGVEFSLTSGAGVGTPYLVLSVKFPDGSRVHEVADVGPMVTEMVSRIIAEHDAAPICPAGEACSGAAFPGHPAHPTEVPE